MLQLTKAGAKPPPVVSHVLKNPIHCICQEIMQLTQPGQVYEYDVYQAAVRCDNSECRAVIGKMEWCYHCPKGPLVHPNGYDYCVQCAKKISYFGKCICCYKSYICKLLRAMKLRENYMNKWGALMCFIWILAVGAICYVITVYGSILREECSLCEYKYTSCVVKSIDMEEIDVLYSVDNHAWNYTHQFKTELKDLNDVSILSIQTCLVNSKIPDSLTINDYKAWYQKHPSVVYLNDKKGGMATTYYITGMVVFCVGLVSFIICSIINAARISGKKTKPLQRYICSWFMYSCFGGCCCGFTALGLSMIIIGSIIANPLKYPPSKATFTDIYNEYYCSIQGINDIKYYKGFKKTNVTDYNVDFALVEYNILSATHTDQMIGISIVSDISEDDLGPLNIEEFNDIYDESKMTLINATFTEEFDALKLFFSLDEMVLCIENKDTQQIIVTANGFSEEEFGINWLKYAWFTVNISVVVMGVFLFVSLIVLQFPIWYIHGCQAVDGNWTWQTRNNSNTNTNRKTKKKKKETLVSQHRNVKIIPTNTNTNSRNDKVEIDDEEEQETHEKKKQKKDELEFKIAFDLLTEAVNVYFSDYGGNKEEDCVPKLQINKWRHLLMSKDIHHLVVNDVIDFAITENLFIKAKKHESDIDYSDENV
eukprot:542586_1